MTGFDGTRYFPIDAYGIIGDLHTCALISPRGGIDWCCFPFFDSASVFARILDHNRGGGFEVAPFKYEHSGLRYLHNTNILCTKFDGPDGDLEVLDYMPVINPDGTRAHTEAAFICRHLECTKGTRIKVRIRFDPRPDYGRQQPAIEYAERSAHCPDHTLRLVSSNYIKWDPACGDGTITLSHGDSARLVLCYGNSAGPTSNIVDWTDEQLMNTRHYWETWLAKCRYKGRWRRMVERSALALKLLTFKPTGAILAAASTSLPEEIGGERNWDYRFSWLRDSALTLNALYILGYNEEAKDYERWLLSRRPAVGDQMPILYPISDLDTTVETVLDHLEGYQGSRPVRIGNGAATQIQLDVYGEVIDSLFLYNVHGQEINNSTWVYIRELAERICTEWQQPDEGIWEVRGGRQHFSHSKLMCWVGLDRAACIARERGHKELVACWEEQRDEIRKYILTNCVDPDLGYITQSPTSRTADASNLLVPITNFLSPTDPIVLATLDQTMAQLTRGNMVYRYLAEDGLAGKEGAFNICTFWLVTALAMAGRRDQALTIFDALLEHASSLGLYSEELDPANGVALGNFPQALSHVGLINAAAMLNTELDD